MQTSRLHRSLALLRITTARPSPALSIVLTASLALGLAGCSSSSSTAPTPPALTYTATLSPATLTFANAVVGLPTAAQTVTFANTGTGTLTVSGLATTGAGAAFFTAPPTGCTTLAPGASCTASVSFFPTGSGAVSASLSFTSNAATAPTVALAGTGIATASAANTVDCSTAGALCPNTFTTTTLASDPIAPGGFHGYADPSLRKDPNSSVFYLAYSWPHTLADGTPVVDLHLASSNNTGSTFTEIGPLYQSVQTTQTATTAYSRLNDSSTETVDLLPIPLTGSSAGQTLWVQAHQSYLVKPSSGIYDQLNQTSIISVSAVQLATPASAGAGTALLGLATAPEARLGAVSTDPTRTVTQTLTGLNAATSKCANFGQAALWYQTGTLYLALECTEITGTGMIDSNELAHFVYSTTPTGTDASKWVWAYTGEFATAAQAAKLGSLASENIAYQFFTEPEFALSQSGALIVVMSPSVFAPQTAQQPVIQYACRAIPVTLTPTSVTLDTDLTTGAPVVLARVTESDLYTGTNEGPGACTYEPASINGIVMARKYETDPSLGFFIYPVNSGIKP